ncbi:MAG: hypothetical protein IIZ63_12495 [Caulobacteraceae bacterium]|nr:hypothetical protein [Caulobacteraceae bacterium]
MIRQVLFGAALVVALSSSFASVQAGTPEPAPSAPAVDPGGNTKGHKDPNEKICVSKAETGSRLGGAKVCMTRQQWDEQRMENRRNLEQNQSVGLKAGT